MKQIFMILCVFLILTKTATGKAVKLGRGNLYSFDVFSSLNDSENRELTKMIDCDAGCQTCDVSTGICSACRKDRYILDNLCLVCPEMNYCDGQTMIANCEGVLCLANATPEANTNGCCCTPNCSGVTCKSGFMATPNQTGCCCS